MSTGFPTSIDSLNNPASTGHNLDTAGVLHSDQHANANDAIEALEAKVGVDGSAVTTSLDYLAKIALPKGALANPAQVTSGQTGLGTGSDVDITGLSRAVTVGANRLVKFTVTVGLQHANANEYVALRIKEGATVLRSLITPWNQAATEQTITWVVTLIGPTAGAHTYKVAAARVTGTGALQMNATATTPAEFLVEDIGKAA